MPHNKSIHIWQIMDVMIIMLVSSRSIMTMQSKTRRKNSYWDTVTLTAADLRWAWPFYIWSSWSFYVWSSWSFTYMIIMAVLVLFYCVYFDHASSAWSDLITFEDDYQRNCDQVADEMTISLIITLKEADLFILDLVMYLWCCLWFKSPHFNNISISIRAWWRWVCLWIWIWMG